MVAIYTGCSGYYYNHWKEIFYPADLPKARWLPFYASHFNAVEINSSFYHIPLDSTLVNWYRITPPGFMFTLKGYRYMTHLKKLQVDSTAESMISDFQRKASLLKDKLGCILWQLPRSQGRDLIKLGHFCRALDASIPQVFEFRHPTWYTGEVFEMLRSFGFSLCMVSAPGDLPEMAYATSKTAYLRFHGKNGWYDDNYSNEQLDAWVGKVKQLQAEQLFAYFNNDFHGFAVQNGLYFAKALQAE